MFTNCVLRLVVALAALGLLGAWGCSEGGAGAKSQARLAWDEKRAAYNIEFISPSTNLPVAIVETSLKQNNEGVVITVGNPFTIKSGVATVQVTHSSEGVRANADLASIPQMQGAIPRYALKLPFAGQH